MDYDQPPPYSTLVTPALSNESASRLNRMFSGFELQLNDNPFELSIIKLHSSLPDLNKLIAGYTSTVRDVELKRSELLSHVNKWRNQLQTLLDTNFETLQTEIQQKIDELSKRYQKQRMEMITLTDSVLRLSQTALQISTRGRRDEIDDIIVKLEEKEKQVQSAIEKKIEKSYKNMFYKRGAHPVENYMKKFVGCLGDKSEQRPTSSIISKETSNSENLQTLGNVTKSKSPPKHELKSEFVVQTSRNSKNFLFLRSFSIKTLKDKARCHALSFTFNLQNQIVVPDKYNKNIKIFTQDGQLVNDITHSKLKSPTDVLVLPSNDIAVSDPDNGDVKIFSYDNKLIASLHTCITPYGLELMRDGTMMLVTCIRQKSVSIIDLRSGEIPVSYFKTFMGQNNSIFSYPHYISVQGENTIFVSDRQESCVFELDLRQASQSGNCQIINKWGYGYLKDPYGCCSSNQYGLIVCDYAYNQIQSFIQPTTLSKLILTADNNLDFPTNLKLMETEKKLFVSEYMSGLIKIWTENDNLINTDASQAGCQLEASGFSDRLSSLSILQEYEL